MWWKICGFNNPEKLSTEMNLWFSTNVNKKLIKMKFAANFSSFHSILSLLFFNGARASSAVDVRQRWKMQQQLFEKFARLLSITHISSNFVVSHTYSSAFSREYFLPPPAQCVSCLFAMLLLLIFMTHTDSSLAATLKELSQDSHRKERLDVIFIIIFSH